MDKYYDTNLLRYIFQNHLDVQQNEEAKQALIQLGLDDEMIEQFERLSAWIISHGLEQTRLGDL